MSIFCAIMAYIDSLQEFLREVQAYCATESIAPSTLTNRVLGQTYALPRMLAAAESLDGRIGRLRDAMAGGAQLRRNAVIPPPTGNLRRSITLDLPVPPSTNALHKGDFDGNRFNTHAYANWKRNAGNQIMVDRAAWTKKALPFDQPYIARIRISAKDAADVDNRIKALLDLLVWMQITPDDKHLLHVSAGRSGNVEPSRCLITVRSVPIKTNAI